MRQRADQGDSATPRHRRFVPPGFAYHVGNRGNERHRIFFEDADYERFLRLLIDGRQRYPVKLFGACLIPNHFHAVAEPEEEGALSAYLQWVQGRYGCHLRFVTDSVGMGHVFQGRFWDRGIGDSDHFLSVLRYVEANPIEAGLVENVSDWRWNSLVLRTTLPDAFDPLPFDLPDNWLSVVRDPLSREEIRRILATVRRKRPR